MENAVRVRVTIGADHTVRLPDEIPVGEAEVIILFPTSAAASAPAPAGADLAGKAEARRRMFGRLRGQATIAEDFDAPLPEEILRDFEGHEDP